MMVHIAAIITEDGLVLAWGETPEKFEEAIAETIEDFEPIPDDQIHKVMLTDSEFSEVINGTLDKVRVVLSAEEAIEWAVEEIGAQKVIKEIDDAEDECKKFLEDKDYVIYEDEDDAVDRLSDQAFAKIGGPNVIHAQYAGDAMEKVSEYVAKHGWLKLLNLVEAAL